MITDTITSKNKQLYFQKQPTKTLMKCDEPWLKFRCEKKFKISSFWCQGEYLCVYFSCAACVRVRVRLCVRV